MMNDREQLLRVGMSPAQAAAQAGTFTRCDAALDALGGRRTHRHSVWVPGRIEVLGKHTDYAGGRSLVAAIERGFCVRVALRTDAVIRAVDLRTGSRCETQLDPNASGPAGDWSNYVATVARRLARNFPSARRGVDFAFSSDLPIAAGLSSSSALMIAVFVALAKSNDLRSSEEFRREIFSREELAAYLGAVENGESFRSLDGDLGVGTFGGSQDHAAIMCGEAGRVLQFAFAPLRREAIYRLPESHAFVVGSCGTVAEKTAGARAAYNRASLMVRHLLVQWNATMHRNDGSLGEAAGSSPDAPDQLRRIARESGTMECSSQALLDRLEAFLLESFDLVPRAAASLEAGLLDELGPIVDRSQEASERWLGNQIPETIALARAARELGATAASAFGAGFGGSVYALVRAEEAEEFARAWAARYATLFPDASAGSTFFTSVAGPGANQW